MASISKRIRLNKDGSETITWIGQINENGVRKSFYGKKRKDVAAKIKDYFTDIKMYGCELSKDVYTVSEWTYKHLFTNKLPQLSPATFELYMNSYNNYISTSKLGGMFVGDVKQIHVQEFLNTHTDLSYSSIKKFYLVLLSAFDSACTNNLIRLNPVKGAIIPNKNKAQKKIQALTKMEQSQYIKATEGEPYQLFFLTALFTGLRQGELIALKWEHVHLHTGTIHVQEIIRRNYVYSLDGSSEKKTITKSPKTKTSIREVPIPDFLLELLKQHKPTGTKKEINSRYVFETSTQTCLIASNIRKYHKRICIRAKINPKEIIKGDSHEIEYQGVSFHALRHTFATRSLEVGENIKTLQVLLGHADIETTLNIYTHVLDDTKKASAEKQNTLFKELLL